MIEKAIKKHINIYKESHPNLSLEKFIAAVLGELNKFPDFLNDKHMGYIPDVLIYKERYDRIVKEIEEPDEVAFYGQYDKQIGAHRDVKVKEFKVGDLVISEYMIGIIIQINPDLKYPLTIKFSQDGDIDCYGVNGEYELGGISKWDLKHFIGEE